MIYDTFTRRVLLPISKDFFRAEDFEYIRFIRSQSNKVTQIEIKHIDGYLESYSSL